MIKIRPSKHLTFSAINQIWLSRNLKEESLQEVSSFQNKFEVFIADHFLARYWWYVKTWKIKCKHLSEQIEFVVPPVACEVTFIVNSCYLINNITTIQQRWISQGELRIGFTAAKLGYLKVAHAFSDHLSKPTILIALMDLRLRKCISSCLH